MDKEGLSRKQKLALWRERKGEGAGASASASSSAQQHSKVNSKSSALAPKPGVANGVQRPVSRGNKKNARRKPFQVDTRIVQEASERRVAPGTPIHALKKRLRRTETAENERPKAAGPRAAAREGFDAYRLTARAQAKGKAAVAGRGGGRINGVNRSLDTARTKEVSDYLKSQISEANMLLEISGVDAARTLLADLLSCTAAGKGVGELALYWAARAKLEEDAGIYSAARRTLDEGQAYISMPTQQKVMDKVLAAFEVRMNTRAEVDVAELLEDSVDGLDTSGSNSPTSSTPFRYDPNDLSMDDDSGGPRSAIKNLNFSKIASAEDGVGSGSRESHSFSPAWDGSRDRDTSSKASGTSSGPERGLDWLSGVIFSDDDSDVSIGHIDEAVIARAKAFKDEEAARAARQEADASPYGIESSSHSDFGDSSREVAGLDDNENEARPDEECHTSRAVASSTAVSTTVAATASTVTQQRETGAALSMAPPQPRESRKRKGTPYPKRNTPDGSEGAQENNSPGSFIVKVESKGKDGKRTLTPVRRSRRISSGVVKDPTPSPLRKAMEAML